MSELRGSRDRSMLEYVAERLSPLLDSLTFVGGQVVELLITDPATINIRATKDVDVLVAVASRTEYHRVEDRLRDLGFRNDLDEGSPVCRWKSPEGHKLDLMPVDPAILGFSNEWYPLAVESAAPVELSPGLEIRVPRAPILLATKLAAFRGRGAGDFLASHDMEDIITLVAGRPELVEEVANEAADLRRWISSQMADIVDQPDFRYAVEGALRDSGEISGFYDVMIGSFRALVLPE